jgi:hypothetical protein
VSKSAGRGVILRGALLALLLVTSGTAAAATNEHAPLGVTSRASPSADSPTSDPTSSPPGGHAKTGASKAPSRPPLTAAGQPTGDSEDGAGSLQGEADPLVSNGLGSPLCDGALSSELSGASRRHCETSGFVAASAPTGDYGIDVHIDTGVLGLSSGGLLTTVQDLFVTPVWMALVWVVHALVVMLEWCFTIDLLDSASVGGGVARGLRQMQGTFTNPWLATVLAVAAVVAAYNGLVRRRVAETVGQALLALAMMAGGMWTMLDPAGTVGALGGWANEAGLGTLAVTTRGTPARAGRALADSMGMVFAAAIEVPWCYMEFGDVGWCRDRERMDPRLRAAGLRIAAGERALVGCKLDPNYLSVCAARGSAAAKALEHSAELLRDARSNGALFLALPANGSARNAINDEGSLLRAICRSDDATRCRGPAAAQAEFRTNGGTWARVGGLLLIAAGVLGMILLLGFIALRLLAASLFSLLYLMLAPAAVLAPALGESGRTAFRKWATQLLGAVVSKLLFSFLLGVVLSILTILANLRTLGWWTQWLLMSAFWWGAFARRHQLLDSAGRTLGHEQVNRQRTAARRMSDALDSPRKAIDGARSVKRRLDKRGSDPDRRRKLAQVGRERARVSSGDQSRRTLEHEQREARARADRAPEVQERLSAMRSQLERVRAAHGRALAGGEARRAAELAHREQRIEDGIGREQHELKSASAGGGDRQARRGAPNPLDPEQIEARNRFLDAQAALPASVRAPGGRTAERRDYGALAGLAGYGPREYERLDPGTRRAARLEIDRELALRRESNATAKQIAGDAEGPALRRRERRSANREFDRKLGERMREGGHAMPRTSAPRSGLDAWRSDALGGRDASGSTGSTSSAGSAAVPESSVMRDAREVAKRRKRQLGRDRR